MADHSNHTIASSVAGITTNDAVHSKTSNPPCKHCGYAGKGINGMWYHKPNGVCEEVYFRLAGRPGYEDFGRALTIIMGIAILLGIPAGLLGIAGVLQRLGQ